MIVAEDGVRLEMVTSTVSHQRVPVIERIGHLMSEKRVMRLMRGTGIKHLSIAPLSVCSSDMCVEAAERLFDNGLKREDVGALIFISQTADYLIPATAYHLQTRLRLMKDIVAFDMNLGCSGFVYGIYLASIMVKSMRGRRRKVLVCVGETCGRACHPNDAATLPLFGDAGGVAVVSAVDSKEEKMFFNIESYGERAGCLSMARGGYRAYRLTDDEGNLTDDVGNYVKIDGMAVMNFALAEVPHNITTLLNFTDISISNIGLAAVQQANRVIVENLAEIIGMDSKKMPFDVEDIGNTSSASIPVCLSELVRGGIYKPESIVLLSGFGVGLSVASAIIDMSQTKVLKTGEI